MKFFELFKPIKKGDFGLTEEAIYKSIQHGGTFLPVYGGMEEHIDTEKFVSENGRTKKDKPITKFGGEGIILSLDGSAGSMTYTKDRVFVLNHHACFVEIRDDAKGKVDPEFFSLFYEEELREASVSEGSKTLTSTLLGEMDFELPPFEVQQDIMKKVRPIIGERRELVKLLGKVESLKGKVLAVDYVQYQARNVSIAKVLSCHSGNSGLTEQEVYQHIISDGERFVILSGSTSIETRLGLVPQFILHGKPIKVVEDAEGILVVRKGKAGTVFYMPRGRYTLTDDAYFLTLIKDCHYEVGMKWLIDQYRSLFAEYATSSDNGTWNKGLFFGNVHIDIPSSQEQANVAGLYDRLETFEQSILKMIQRVKLLFAKQVVSGQSVEGSQTEIGKNPTLDAFTMA